MFEKSSIRQLVLPSTLEKICNFAFDHSYKIWEIVIPDDFKPGLYDYLHGTKTYEQLPLGVINMKNYRDMKILVLPEALDVVENWFEFSGVQ